MAAFEGDLTLWIGQCMVAGVALGHVLPEVFQAIGAAEVAKVNLPVPVMLAVVWIVNRSQGWYVRGATRNTTLKPAARDA